MATLYACWNDLLLEGRDVSGDSLLEEFPAGAWHEKKPILRSDAKISRVSRRERSVCRRSVSVCRCPDIPAFGRSWSMTHGAEERMLWSDSFPIAILCSGYVRIPIVALLNDERFSTSGKSVAVFMCKECVTALAGKQIGAHRKSAASIRGRVNCGERR